MSNKYRQKLLDSTKKSKTNAIKVASKRAIQIATETTGGLIGNQIAEKIISVLKFPQNASKKLHSKTDDNEIGIPKERYISAEKRQLIINQLRLV